MICSVILPVRENPCSLYKINHCGPLNSFQEVNYNPKLEAQNAFLEHFKVASLSGVVEHRLMAKWSLLDTHKSRYIYIGISNTNTRMNTRTRWVNLSFTHPFSLGVEGFPKRPGPHTGCKSAGYSRPLFEDYSQWKTDLQYRWRTIVHRMKTNIMSTKCSSKQTFADRPLKAMRICSANLYKCKKSTYRRFQSMQISMVLTVDTSDWERGSEDYQIDHNNRCDTRNDCSLSL